MITGKGDAPGATSVTAVLERPSPAAPPVGRSMLTEERKIATVTDMLTRRVGGLSFQNTYYWNGNALLTTSGLYDLWIPSSQQARVRIKRLSVIWSNGSTLGAQSNAFVHIYDNNVATGIVVVQLLPNAANLNWQSKEDFNLGEEGYVTREVGGHLQVYLPQTITGASGGLIVLAGGHEEIDFQ